MSDVFSVCMYLIDLRVLAVIALLYSPGSSLFIVK